MKSIGRICVAMLMLCLLLSGNAQAQQATSPAPQSNPPPPAAAPPATAPATTPPPAATPAATPPPAAAQPGALPSAAATARRISWREGDNCVQNNINDINTELKSNRHPVGPELLGTTYFLPAGGPVDVVLNTPFRDGAYYFAYIERHDDSKKHAVLGRGLVTTNRIPGDHSLVQKGIAERTDTLVTVRIPDFIGGPWKKADLYVYSCAPTGSPSSVSKLTMRVSSPIYAGALVWLAAGLIYMLAALACQATDVNGVSWFRYLDPVYLTADSNGKGSMSKLQILFFSMIVAGLLAYIVVRTGVLSDVSTTILGLLGIAGIGSAAAKGTDVARNRLSPDNAGWLYRKKWLGTSGLAATSKPSWRDIIMSDGEFDVYRYQNCIFSLIVGIALLVTGVNELATFSIPQTLLGILGLSQGVYLAGKLVTPTSIGDLDTAMTELRELEKKFTDAATTNPDPAPAGPGDPLSVAKRRAGDVNYNNYINKAQTVRLQFESVTGRQVDDALIQPTVGG